MFRRWHFPRRPPLSRNVRGRSEAGHVSCVETSRLFGVLDPVIRGQVQHPPPARGSTALTEFTHHHYWDECFTLWHRPYVQIECYRFDPFWVPPRWSSRVQIVIFKRFEENLKREWRRLCPDWTSLHPPSAVIYLNTHISNAAIDRSLIEHGRHLAQTFPLPNLNWSACAYFILVFRRSSRRRWNRGVERKKRFIHVFL